MSCDFGKIQFHTKYSIYVYCHVFKTNEIKIKKNRKKRVCKIRLIWKVNGEAPYLTAGASLRHE